MSEVKTEKVKTEKVEIETQKETQKERSILTFENVVIALCGSGAQFGATPAARAVQIIATAEEIIKKIKEGK